MDIADAIRCITYRYARWRVTDHDNNSRLVELHAIFESSTGRRLCHCYQVEGFSASNAPQGWKNLDLESIAQIELDPSSFTPRPDFNPFNRDIMPRMLFSLPTADGLHRVPDL